MSFLDKLTDAAASIGDKANDAIEITKLKSKINSEKKAIESDLAKIGRIYYAMMKNEGFELTEEAAELSRKIDAHYAVISETEEVLSRYKSETL